MSHIIIRELSKSYRNQRNRPRANDLKPGYTTHIPVLDNINLEFFPVRWFACWAHQDAVNPRS